MPDLITRLSDEMARDPSSMAWVALAEALRRAKRLDAAERTAIRGLERHPYHADGHDVLARIHADTGDVTSAGDEWAMALQLAPRHLSALMGMGWIAFRNGDVSQVECFLRQARDVAPNDARVRSACARFLPKEGSEPRSVASHGARALFQDLEEAGAVTALVVDHDGLVLAGRTRGDPDTQAADVLGAELSGVSLEASRALLQLQLGAWESLVVECDEGTLAVSPGRRDSAVLVATLPNTPGGFTRMLLERARRRADGWMEAR